MTSFVFHHRGQRWLEKGRAELKAHPSPVALELVDACLRLHLDQAVRGRTNGREDEGVLRENRSHGAQCYLWRARAREAKSRSCETILRCAPREARMGRKKTGRARALSRSSSRMAAAV